MPTHAPPLTRLLFILLLFCATGCPQEGQQTSQQDESATPVIVQVPATTAATQESTPLPTDYRSSMVFSVDLLDSETALPMPADLATLEPVILREVYLITSEPIFRQILNKPIVQATAWFKQYELDLDAALQALEQSVVAHHVPGTPLIKVYALQSLATDNTEDAQIILRALSDEYIRLKAIAVNASIDEQLTIAQRARNDAEQVLRDSTVQLKRHLQNNPISSRDVERSRINALETEALQQQVRHAQARREAAITNIVELQQKTNGFLGYKVNLVIPAQRER